jgi:hypothetical protein
MMSGDGRGDDVFNRSNESNESIESIESTESMERYKCRVVF